MRTRKRLAIFTAIAVIATAAFGAPVASKLIAQHREREAARAELVTFVVDVSDLIDRGVFPKRPIPTGPGRSGSGALFPVPRDVEMDAAIARALPIAEGWKPPAIAQYDGRTRSLVITHNRLAYEQIEEAVEDLRLRSFR